jgi:serine/threonine protein kinase
VPEIGELLAAKYRVLSLLGAGGMGSVYRAENVLTGKQVALKWMHPQFAESPDAAERLIREARAASKLSHPNVVDVYDVIRDDKTLFLVMELLHGESLRDYLRQRARPPMHELIGLLLGAMAGVAAAHAQGVIHRDLKPDNIFLLHVPGMPQPIAKVVDFGIAKMAEIRGATLTQTGAAIGTPVYMSFEQLRGDRDVDHRTDVYAFGVMLYEAFVGYAPFTAATLSELAIKVATMDPVPIKNLRPDAPSALCAIIDRAIARNRDLRWPDVPTLMQQLTPFAQAASFREHMTFRDMTTPRLAPHRQGQGQRPAASPLDAPFTTGAGTVALSTQPEAFVAAATPRPASHYPSDSLIGRELGDVERPKSNPLPVWLAAAALLAVALVAAFLLLGESKPPSAARPLGAQTSISAASAPLPTPNVPPPTAATQALQFEQLPPIAAPSVEPVPPTTPLTAAHVTEDSENPEQTGRGSRRRRARSGTHTGNYMREQERPEQPAERRTDRPESAPPPAAKQKNATDLLGF